MASLRSMIRDRKYGLGWDGKHPIDKEMEPILIEQVEVVHDALSESDTILVNAQSVADTVMALKDDEVVHFCSIPCPKPPFRQMWLEAKMKPGQRPCDCCGGETVLKRIGALVNRFDGERFLQWMDSAVSNQSEQSLYARVKGDAPADMMLASVWCDDDAAALYMGRIYWWMDKDGNYLDASFFPVEEDFNFELVWLLHSFARMNCHNVKLVPQTAGGPRIKKGKPHPPYSYWHEIVVTSLPELRRQQKGELAPDGEKREVRFHKVRGHYADYTQGKGLFGKWKIRIWIEDHTAGSPELGTVLSSYAVQ